jgi:hypothetical protein
MMINTTYPFLLSIINENKQIKVQWIPIYQSFTNGFYGYICELCKIVEKHSHNQADRKFNKEMFPFRDILLYVCRKRND